MSEGISATSTIAFIDLSWNNKIQGRISIRLYSDAPPTVKFMTMCSAVNWATLKGTTMFSPSPVDIPVSKKEEEISEKKKIIHLKTKEKIITCVSYSNKSGQNKKSYIMETLDRRKSDVSDITERKYSNASTSDRKASTGSDAMHSDKSGIRDESDICFEVEDFSQRKVSDASFISRCSIKSSQFLDSPSVSRKSSVSFAEQDEVFEGSSTSVMKSTKSKQPYKRTPNTLQVPLQRRSTRRSLREQDLVTTQPALLCSSPNGAYFYIILDGKSSKSDIVLGEVIGGIAILKKASKVVSTNGVMIYDCGLGVRKWELGGQ